MPLAQCLSLYGSFSKGVAGSLDMCRDARVNVGNVGHAVKCRWMLLVRIPAL